MPRIRIAWASGEVSAELRDTPTVRGLIAVLPCDSSATPISRGMECRLVTRCNVLGRLEGDPGVLGGVRDGDAIQVTLIDS
jgi:hypothetical protein